MNNDTIKRNYHDIRMGWSTFGPLIGYSNFMLLVYNFTSLKETIPFYVFLPLFSIGAAIILIYAGKTMRKKQYSTDLDLTYVEASEAAKSLRILFDLILDPENLQKRKDATDRRDFLKGIEDKKLERRNDNS